LALAGALAPLRTWPGTMLTAATAAALPSNARRDIIRCAFMCSWSLIVVLLNSPAAPGPNDDTGDTLPALAHHHTLEFPATPVLPSGQ